MLERFIRFHFSPADGGACWQDLEEYCGDLTAYRGRGPGAGAHADGRRVRVQALGRDGGLLAGLAPVTANLSDARFRWQCGDIATLNGKTAGFCFEQSDAKLYAPGGGTQFDTKQERTIARDVDAFPR